MLIILWILLSLLIGYAGRRRRIGFLGFFLGSLLMAMALALAITAIPALVATTVFFLIILLITAPRRGKA
ncbi:MAG TPA: hypothetical protein VNE16_06370 [Vicinamibacterales bacterium]|nr:hypothetical protein [Vicinamibacterales bacterium]